MFPRPDEANRSSAAQPVLGPMLLQACASSCCAHVFGLRRPPAVLTSAVFECPLMLNLTPMVDVLDLEEVRRSVVIRGCEF